MVCAPVSPRSEPCKRASRRLLPLLQTRAIACAVALALLVVPSRLPSARADQARTLLLLPVGGHWVSAPLAQAVTQELPEALAAAGISATLWDPEAAPPEWGERTVRPDTPEKDRVESAQHMAVAAGVEAGLVAEVAEAPPEVALRAQLVGAISHYRVSVEFTLPAAGDREQQARALAQGLAAKLTPELWAQAGADEAGQQCAAAERYASGQAALADHRYRDAALEFAAALLAAPDNPDYLRGAGEAAAGFGDYETAATLYRRLVELRPDQEMLLRAGDLALLAGQPVQAEAAFLQAADTDPPDPRAVEGLARSARAQGQAARAQQYYQQLIASLPELSSAPSWLAGLLADQQDDSIRLTALPAGEINLPLGRLYLRNGYYSEGVRLLLDYQVNAQRPPYTDPDYLEIAAGLDEEGEQIAQQVADLTRPPPDQLGDDQRGDKLEDLHQRSDRLATLGERMSVSPRLDPAHRYRVLAYNLLNQSDFEALLYSQTHDQDRQRRAALLRDAFRKARAQARQLAADLTSSGE